MTLEEEFYKYYESRRFIGKELKQEIADLAKIVKNRQEVIAEGKFICYEYDADIRDKNDNCVISLLKYHDEPLKLFDMNDKQVILSLEVKE
ncbi:MAG: hypothetical protein WC554_02855 [Clostridia bacterium]|jgi:trimethylamine:corrinoid methyltransferase-like protein